MHLPVVSILLLKALHHHKHTTTRQHAPDKIGMLLGHGSRRSKRPRMHGNERAVSKLEHVDAIGAVERKRQTMVASTLEGLAKHQGLDVGTYDGAALLAR